MDRFQQMDSRAGHSQATRSFVTRWLSSTNRIHAMRRLHVLAAIVGASVIVLLPINDFDEIAILGLARAPGAAAHWAAWLFVGRFGMLLGASATVYGMSMWLEARRHRRAMAWSGACLALPPRGNASAR
jgi:hypothetical protein